MKRSSGFLAFSVFLFVSFVLMLTIGTQTALAQQRTCSGAQQWCASEGCQKERTGDCFAFCRSEFERCLKTGEFRGRHRHGMGLIKK